MKGRGTLLCVALVMGCGHAPRARHPARYDGVWKEVLSSHFSLRTNLSEPEAEAASHELEQLRAALVVGVFHMEVDPPGRLNAVLFRDSDELEEFVDRRIDGYVTATQVGPLLVSSSSNMKNGEGRARLLHELTHYLSSFTFLRQPTWFAEGLAEYGEAAETSGSTVRLGLRHAENVAELRRHGVLPLDAIWAAEDPENSELAFSFHFYASSWIWFHFFEDKYPRQMAEYEDMLRRAEDPVEAYATAFVNMKTVHLDDEIQKYLTQDRFGVKSVHVVPEHSVLKIHSLDAADVHAIRAQLFLESPMRRTAAEKHSLANDELQQALALNPAQVEAVILHANDQKPADRRLAARALVKAHPSDGRAWTFLAGELEPLPEAREERLQALETATRLNPDDALALNNLAWERVQHGSAALGLKLAARAVQIAPWSPSMLDTYAAALFKVGRCVEARASQERAVSLLHEQASDDTRQQLLASLVLYRRTCPGAE